MGFNGFNELGGYQCGSLQELMGWSSTRATGTLDLSQCIGSATSDADYARRMAQNAAPSWIEQAIAVGALRPVPTPHKIDRLEWQEESPSKLWRAWDWTIRAFAAFGVYSLVRVFL